MMASVEPGEGFEGSHRTPERDAEPLLMAKITPPALPGWNVPRPRVDKCVDKGVRQGMITVVSGPAGAGKTTALAAWAAEADWAGPVAWLTLDEYDNQPGVFWRYLSAALRRADLPVPPDGTAGEQGSQAGPSGAAPLRVASALAGQQPAAVIVLDNLHVLREQTVTAGLAHMLRHAGPGLRMLIGSRTEPPLPLHRYLLTGDLTEISGSQLAFTGPEARLLLSKHDVTAYSQSLVSLIRKTEGWAAGLRLAAIALNRAAAEGAERPRSVEDPVTAYLNEEVIDPRPRLVRDFLLRTSVVDSVGPDLAAALTGRERSAAMLAELVRSNLFTGQLADGQYRYHALFADVLRARLRAEHPGLTGELQRRAAVWYHEHGQLADAVRYAARIGDWQLAAGFVIDELGMSRLLHPEHGRDLVGSLQAITSAAPLSGPQPSLVAAAVALASADHDASALWLRRADELLQSLSIDQEVPSRYAAAVIRFELARYQGDLDALYCAAAEAETVLSRLPADVRARHAELSAWVRASQGTAALWLGRFEAAGRILAEAASVPLPPAAEADRATWTGHLALAEALRGQLERAAELAARAICLAGEASDSAPEPPPNAAADVALAWVHLERDELTEVRSSLRRAEAGLRTRRDRAAAATASLVAARLHLAEGRYTVAVRMLGRARQGWSVPGWLERRLTLAEACACTMAGDAEAALAAAGRCGARDELDVAAARAAAMMAVGEIKAAGRAVRRALERAEQDPEHVLDPALLDALLVDARIHYAAGDRAAGHRSLARALRIGRSEDVRLPFAMERAWIVPVLRTDAELTAGYQALFQPLQASDGDDDLQSLLSGLEQSPVVEPLTGREQEVLKRVAQLMSTAEIAAELYISVNTVKTHLKSVHRKLAVTHRREAVRRARQLKLI